MHDWSPGWWIAMGLMMVVFWGLLIAGVVWLVRSLMHGREGEPTGRGKEPTAHEMLERRLALGEVSVEEYEERRRALSGREDQPARAPEQGSSGGDSP